MRSKLAILCLSLVVNNAFAVLVQNSSAPVTRQIVSNPEKLHPSTNNAQVSTATVMSSLNPSESPQFNNLSSIDSDTDDLNQLKRKVQIEKAQAELKKIKTGSNGVTAKSTGAVNNENAQTTVTGVAINQEGKKIAWLQFADGGSLTVNIGSKVGKYTVSDISMTGVTLSEVSGSKKKSKNIYLKRAYATADTGKKPVTNNNNANMFFTPSPVLTGANALNNENLMVPPIVSNK